MDVNMEVNYHHMGAMLIIFDSHSYDEAHELLEGGGWVVRVGAGVLLSHQSSCRYGAARLQRLPPSVFQLVNSARLTILHGHVPLARLHLLIPACRLIRALFN